MWERLKFTQRFAWVNKTKVGFYILTSCLCKGRVQKSLVFCQTHTQVHHVVADSSGMESIKGKINMFWDLLTSSPKMFFEVQDKNNPFGAYIYSYTHLVTIWGTTFII